MVIRPNGQIWIIITNKKNHMKLVPLFEVNESDIKKLVTAAHKAYTKEEEANHDEDSGNPFSICTYGAEWVKEKFFPKAVIMGYHADDNPDAIIGQDEGGHDFLILSDRYIIDFWYNNMIDSKAPVFIDMEKDEALAKKYYGDKTTWEKVPE